MFQQGDETYVTLDLQGYRVGSFNETMVKSLDEQNK
jgi:uncharacterized protein